MSAISVWFASLKANYSADIIVCTKWLRLFLLSRIQTVIYLVQRASMPPSVKKNVKMVCLNFRTLAIKEELCGIYYLDIAWQVDKKIALLQEMLQGVTVLALFNYRLIFKQIKWFVTFGLAKMSMFCRSLGHRPLKKHFVINVNLTLYIFACVYYFSFLLSMEM